MSKTKKDKRRLLDYDDEEFFDKRTLNKPNKSKIKRFDRAIKTLDIDLLTDEEYEERDW